MKNPVIHLRTMREHGETEAALTPGPVSVAADELIRDLTERCGHTVRTGRRTYGVNGEMVRCDFEVDVTLKPDKFHAEPRTYTWDESVVRPSEPYSRMPAKQATA